MEIIHIYIYILINIFDIFWIFGGGGGGMDLEICWDILHVLGRKYILDWIF